MKMCDKCGSFYVNLNIRTRLIKYKEKVFEVEECICSPCSINEGQKEDDN